MAILIISDREFEKTKLKAKEELHKILLNSPSENNSHKSLWANNRALKNEAKLTEWKEIEKFTLLLDTLILSLSNRNPKGKYLGV